MSGALLKGVPRPRGRDLTGPELQAFVEELASRPELWIELVKHDATQRVYEELLNDAHLTVWLICWMDDHDTGFHDHDVSAGAVAVVGGRVREERLTLDGEPRNRVFGAGQSFHFSPADIHRVRHFGADPAVTLHAYSPPLLRMGAYAIGPEGVLERHPVAHTEELRPQGRDAQPSPLQLPREQSAVLGALAVLDAAVAGDEDVADELRCEEAMLDDPGRR